MSTAGSADALAAFRRAVPLLRCPVCSEPVHAVGTAGPAGIDEAAGTVEAVAPTEPITGVRCTAGHSFDRARQGHLSLFGPRGRRFPGDTTDQVAARERVLGSGTYDPVATMLAGVARGALDGTHEPVILEAGAGTGFYLARVLEELRAKPESDPESDLGPDRESATEHEPGSVPSTVPAAGPLGIGTEISVAAARRLAKCSTGVAALVADTWDGLPLVDSSIDLLQVVFAPRNAAEFARVLVPGGMLVVAGPGEGHLEPLRSAAGMLTPESAKADRLEAGLAGLFTPGEVHVVDTTVTVPGAIAVDLALMGPSGVHLDRASVERDLGGRDHQVRIHVEARTYRVAG